ncbi:MAG: hypothetical protein HQK61_00060 [Desulfamplus sp.]|nr:hypothetical protein [Desulfamplus sp.]
MLLTDNVHALMGTTKNESLVITTVSGDFHIKFKEATEDEKRRFDRIGWRT